MPWKMYCQNFCEIAAPAIEALFNTVVRALAAQGVFPRQVTLALDPTDVETSARFGGAGHVTREARQCMRQARAGTFMDGATRHERNVQVKRGQGRTQHIETQTTIVWGIEGLVGQDTYGPEEECKKKHRKDARLPQLSAAHGLRSPRNQSGL